MINFEIVLLIAGSILFLFSLVVMILLIKKGKPFTMIIWFLVMSFLMMGFPSITEAEFIGFKYQKEKKLNELGVLVSALEYCPDNEEIKAILGEKLKEFEESEEAKNSEEKILLAKANLFLGEETKAIEYTTDALILDSTSMEAKGVREMAVIQGLLKELPKVDTIVDLPDYVKKRFQELKKNPTITDKQINRLQSYNIYKPEAVKINTEGNNR